MSYPRMTLNLARVANAFIKKAIDEGTTITPMKLIKLCYIAQGMSLAENDNLLFNDEVQAWRYGPVIPSLYYDVKEFASDPITRYCAPVSASVDDSDPEKLDEQQKKIVNYAWEQLSAWTAGELSAWTHRVGSAWYQVTGGKTLGSNLTIDTEIIKNEFRTLQIKD